LDYSARNVFNLIPALASVPNYGFAILVLSLQTFKTHLPKMWLGVPDFGAFFLFLD
jgi:hypothetical protein